MEKNEWSRDWRAFDWEELSLKLLLMEQDAEESQGIGISQKEFIEYLEWLHENERDKWVKLMLGWKLYDMGVDIERAEQLVSHPEVLDYILGESKWEITNGNLLNKIVFFLYFN